MTDSMIIGPEAAARNESFMKNQGFHIHAQVSCYAVQIVEYTLAKVNIQDGGKRRMTDVYEVMEVSVKVKTLLASGIAGLLMLGSSSTLGV